MSSYRILIVKLVGGLFVSVAVAAVAVLVSYLLYNPRGIDKASYPQLVVAEAEQPAASETTQPATPPEQPATQPAQPEASPEQPETQPEQPEAPPAAASGLGVLLASADVEAGRKLAKKCAACHTIDKGGKNKIGPNLWDVLGRDIGAAEGFKFSGALANMGGVWGYQALDGFIEKPKAFASGTKMSFSGIKSETDRADLIVYLRSLSDNPKPLP